MEDTLEQDELYESLFTAHRGGKIEIKSRLSIKDKQDLAKVYTPGVAKICTLIANNPRAVYQVTIKQNTVGIVTDGSAVLGLGNLGPYAAIPVMEGKAMLLKDFAGVDAFPICLDTQDIEEIIKTIRYIAPIFGAINLEDISSPRCFEIEQRLKEELDIPVFHDDQHGTAIVVLATFINALKLVGKKPENIKVVVSGVGAAGVACTQMLQNYGVKHIIGCDRQGALSLSRSDLKGVKYQYAMTTNPHQEKGSLQNIIKGADIFIGLSTSNLLTVDDLKNMNSDPIVFAMANPIPEIMPEIALPHVAIMATGRSDYPNQINNALAFPGVFRGVLDAQASTISESMKVAAAYAIANVIKESELRSDYVVPSLFDKRVVPAVAEAVKAAVKIATS